jgi:hypothetical protein
MDNPNGKPVFRNPDKVPVLRFRELLRDKGLTPEKGLVVEDIDIVALRYGPIIGRHKDADGEFILGEVKHGLAKTDYAQRRTFSLINRLLRLGDPEKKYYKGFFLIQELEDSTWRVNGTTLSESQFVEFIEGKLIITPASN